MGDNKTHDLDTTDEVCKVAYCRNCAAPVILVQCNKCDEWFCEKEIYELPGDLGWNTIDLCQKCAVEAGQWAENQNKYNK